MKKIKILEIIILITIILSIIVILLFAYNTLNVKPEISNSNQVQNYSKTRYFQYSALITDSYIYQIPSQELILTDYSSYTKFITSTDNLINGYSEIIIIKYNQLLPEEETIIKNYCNTYDIIELEYKFQCTYSKNVLKIFNSIYLDKIKDPSNIKNNHNIPINIPVQLNERLNEYLEILKNNNIIAIEVDKIA